jgi:riboflavin kinase/FMN adenylyltransferase
MTVGVFDGLHLGHQFLVKKTIARARELNVPSLVLTFAPHPLAVLSPSGAPEILTTVSQKREILQGLGLSTLGVLRFDEAMSALAPEAFLNEVIAPRVLPVEILIGPDFRFGKNAEGHFDLLKAWGKTRGIKTLAVPIQETLGGETISSSHARGLIKIGHVEAVAKILGRPYRIEGEVVKGQRRGRTLGFPTANLGKMEQLLPGPGVYAALARLRGKVFAAMTSIGHNPTFKGRYLTVESYLLDFSDNCYGEKLEVDFIQRVRGVIRFETVEALVAQLREDEIKARSVLRDFLGTIA